MVFGYRAASAYLLISCLACSTEDTGLYSYDATVAQQGMEQPDPVPPPKPPMTKVDARPMDSRPDASATPDAPAPAIDVAPDLAPDVPPPIVDQPTGVACGGDGQCKSGHCIDGVCCESACNDGCSACTQARTGKPDGTCATAPDRAGKVCGKGCSTVAAVPSLVEKVCTAAGACVIPSGKPTVIESCHDSDPCVVAFCDDNDARCVRTGCGQGSCCCKSQNDRMCMRQDQCHGGGKTCQ